jgi:glutathione S-transferase
MYRLFYSPGACSLAPHIVLEEIGVPYDLDLRSTMGAAGTSAPDYLAINPKGRVPALFGVPGRSGGANGLLTEASAILVYLARAHPDHVALLPGGPAGEARCIEWLNWLSESVHGMSFAQLWRPQRFVSDPALFPAVVAKGRENLAEQYRYIESILADGRAWALPDGYSVADAFLLVFWRWGARIGFDMAGQFPAWTLLSAQTVARAAVRRAIEQEGLHLEPEIGSLFGRAQPSPSGLSI